MTTYQYETGTVKTGTNTRSGSHYVRVDTWTDLTGDTETMTALSASADDESDRHSIVNSYDPRCSCCWLRIAHAERLHIDRVSKSGYATVSDYDANNLMVTL